MQLQRQQFGSSGEPLVVLHGLFGSGENWHSMCLRLGAEFRVWALDQRNHGASPHSTQMDYPTMAADVLEFMADQGLQEVHLLGHSMGAKTAMALALLHPSNVRSLVSVDMAPRAYSPRHDKILDGMLALNLDSLRDRRRMELALESQVPDLATRRFLLKNVRRSAGGFHWRIGLHEIASNYSHLSEAVEGQPYPGPALFVRGDGSDYLGERDLPLIQKLFPRAELKTVPGAGHLVHVDQPEALLETLRDFFARARL